MIELANQIFGFNGWSSAVVDITPDYIEQNDKGRFVVGVTAVVKVMLKDGTFHEDVGYGMSENPKKGSAIENAKKEAVSDARKRALRLFGSALGNCLYDKEHLRKVKTSKAGAPGFLAATPVNPYIDTIPYTSASKIDGSSSWKPNSANPATPSCSSPVKSPNYTDTNANNNASYPNTNTTFNNNNYTNNNSHSSLSSVGSAITESLPLASADATLNNSQFGSSIQQEEDDAAFLATLANYETQVTQQLPVTQGSGYTPPGGSGATVTGKRASPERATPNHNNNYNNNNNGSGGGFNQNQQSLSSGGGYSQGGGFQHQQQQSQQGQCWSKTVVTNPHLVNNNMDKRLRTN